jgi:SAM-dependent methyltransferase
MALPFPDESFDVVVCQFGIMFFPDRPRAHAEAWRVLKPSGRYIFNTWDGLSRNPDAEIVERAVAALYPPGAIGFLGRTPFGYHHPDLIRGDLAAAGFRASAIESVPCSFDTTAHDAAVGYCYGTPLRAEIEAVDAGGVAKAVEVARQALAKRFGGGSISAPRQALVVETTK